MPEFRILKKDRNTRARAGILKTAHGVIHTPAFVPVATKGALRGISFENANKFGGDIFMVNTFHFYVDGKYKLVKKFGGLHEFLNIGYPLMTDSGGFQVFSLGFGLEHGVGKISNMFPGENRPGQHPKDNPALKKKNLVKITEEGAEFKYYKNGKKLFLDAETSIKTQKQLGADIIFAFDECTSPLSDYEYTKMSIDRTHRWAVRSLKEFEKGPKTDQGMMGIIQGGEFKDLREKAVEFVSSLPFFGFGIGGPLGQSKKDMHKILDWTLPILPESKPKHLLGIGDVDDIFNGVERGIDTFDCVNPTRLARHGTALTHGGRISLKSGRYVNSKEPVDKKCGCRICQNYSRAYVSSLLRDWEIYGVMLLVEHNLFYMLNLMREIRQAIKDGKFGELRRKYLK